MVRLYKTVFFGAVLLLTGFAFIQDGKAQETPDPGKGVLLGQPDASENPMVYSCVGVGLHPCARDEQQAKERIKQFFSTVEQVELAPDEIEYRLKNGMPATVDRLQYLPASIEQASVTRYPMYFQIRFPNDPDRISQEDRDKYPWIRNWYVLNCDYFDYVYTDAGRNVTSGGLYPFDDLPADQVYSYQSGGVWREYQGKVYVESPVRTHQFVKEDYLRTLKFARLKKSAVTSMVQFEEFVNFLYKIQILALSGFNQSGKRLDRQRADTEGTFTITDTIVWQTFNDVPPYDTQESRMQVTVSYDKNTGEVDLQRTIQGAPGL